MEKYRPIPPSEAIVSTPDALNWGLEESLSDRELQDMLWNQQRIANRQHNLQLADNVFVHGTLFRCGVGQKKAHIP